MNKSEDQTSSVDFILGKVGSRLLRFQKIEEVPTDVSPITLETVREMSKEEIGELYGRVAGVQPKNFKDKKIAIESLVYQVAKMATTDPRLAAVDTNTGAQGNGKQVEENLARKSSEVFELLAPVDADAALSGLAPQARELMLIMTELAQEKGSTKFSAGDLSTKLTSPVVIERLKTKQDPLRILQYYKGKLIGVGLIRTS